MKYDYAISVLERTREQNKGIPVLRVRIERAEQRIHESQKLTASYGTEHVSGGKQHSGVEDAVIQAVDNAKRYRALLKQAEADDEEADRIIRKTGMPRRTFKLANYYFRKSWTVERICRYKHWTARNSWYKWLDKYKILLKATLEPVPKRRGRKPKKK